MAVARTNRRKVKRAEQHYGRRYCDERRGKGPAAKAHDIQLRAPLRGVNDAQHAAGRAHICRKPICPAAAGQIPGGGGLFIVRGIFLNHSFCFSAAALCDIRTPNRVAPQPKNKKNKRTVLVAQYWLSHNTSLLRGAVLAVGLL